MWAATASTLMPAPGQDPRCSGMSSPARARENRRRSPRVPRDTRTTASARRDGSGRARVPRRARGCFVVKLGKRRCMLQLRAPAQNGDRPCQRGRALAHRSEPAEHCPRHAMRADCCDSPGGAGCRAYLSVEEGGDKFAEEERVAARRSVGGRGEGRVRFLGETNLKHHRNGLPAKRARPNDVGHTCAELGQQVVFAARLRWPPRRGAPSPPPDP